MSTTRACPSGKRPYASRDHARYTLRKLTDRKGGNLLHAYRCPDCQQWHLGTQPARNSAVRAYERVERLLRQSRHPSP